VAVLAGWGCAFGLVGGTAGRGVAKWPGLLLAYALPTAAPSPEQIQAHISRPGEFADGERLYHRWCARCHGAGAVSSSAVPDLRESATRLGDGLSAVARHGLPGTGMPALGAELSEADAERILRYLQELNAVR